jgi:hypothetical protein
MRAANILVFDEIVQSPAGVKTSVNTDQSLNDRLGAFDMLALMAVVDSLSGTGKLWVQIEHSADGRNWLSKNGDDAEIGGATGAPPPPPAPPSPSSPLGIALSGPVQTFYAGSDAGTTVSLAFVRLRVDVEASAGAAISGRVRVFVTGRNWGR